MLDYLKLGSSAPRIDHNSYPLDLDGSLRYTRPYVIDPYPYPPIIDMIQGFCREFDAFIYKTGFAKTPYGPNVNNTPTYADYQIAIAGLNKFGNVTP